VIGARWALALAFGAVTGCEPAPTAPAARPADPEIQDPDLADLEALGYLGSETEAGGAVGLLFHDERLAQPGLNFYVSGHAAEAVLMDMQARVLHRWSLAFASVFPDAPPDPEAEERGRHHWRRAYLQADGDLIAIHEGQGLVRLDARSELVWKSPLRAHHAAQITPSGELWVLSRKIHEARFRGRQVPIAEDFVSVLDATTGELLRETSVLEALRGSEFRELLADAKDEGDLLHTNALELLDGRCAARHPAFAAGNLLLSSRVLSALFVLDPRADAGRGRVLWAQRGSFRFQHEPRLLEDCSILLFDNSGAEPHSRVLEVEIGSSAAPAGERVVYAGSPERRFYTRFCGAAARLANGNTLITETGPGRAFEVTPQGQIAWEFVNPFEDQGKVASIFELVRLPADATDGWRR
jgi:hypothetical protein